MIAVRSPHRPPWWRYASPTGLVADLWRHRRLIGQLARRDVQARYRGSVLGPLWTLLTPTLALLTYAFVFGTVLNVRWGHTPATTGLGFALTLISGLLVFNVFSEVAGRAPHLVVSQPNFVKKVVFPTEVLPVAALGAALVHLLLSLTAVGLVAMLWGLNPSWRLLWLPAVLVPYAGLLLGVGWLLAAAGAFLRDTGPTVTALCQFLLFLTPVFYPLAQVPQPYRGLLRLNPLAAVVEGSRCALVGGDAPPLGALAALVALAAVTMQVGYAAFMAAKPALADVV